MDEVNMELLYNEESWEGRELDRTMRRAGFSRDGYGQWKGRGDLVAAINPSSVPFSKLKRGDLFSFPRESKATHPALLEGPWVKVSSRGYRHIEERRDPQGTIQVRRLDIKVVPISARANPEQSARTPLDPSSWHVFDLGEGMGFAVAAPYVQGTVMTFRRGKERFPLLMAKWRHLRTDPMVQRYKTRGGASTALTRFQESIR